MEAVTKEIFSTIKKFEIPGWINLTIDQIKVTKIR